MILPNKHVRTERALIGVGAEVLETLREPMTVSRLWDEVRQRRSVASPNAPIDYNWFYPGARISCSRWVRLRLNAAFYIGCPDDSVHQQRSLRHSKSWNSAPV